TLTPAVKGKEHWLGTRTVVFQPEGGRFPAATEYKVTIDAGTKGVVGAPLSEAVAFSFATPAPRLVDFWPQSEADLDTPIVLHFDQQIDPQAVLAKTKIDGAQLVLGDPSDKRIRDRVTAAEKGTWVVVRPARPFSPDHKISVEIQAGLAGKEGPRLTAQPLSRTFSTYPPFKVAHTQCETTGCSPEAELAIEMTTELDTDAFRDSYVTVTPAIPDMAVQASWRDLTISGALTPNTTYTVTLDPKLSDIHHQPLGTQTVVKLPVTHASPRLYGASGVAIVPPATPALDYYSSQYSALKVSLYKVTPEDFVRYQLGDWVVPAAKLRPASFAFEVKTAGKPLLDTTSVDISKALANGRGQVVAIVEPVGWSNMTSAPPRFITWVQATQLAIDAHVDQDHLVVAATDLLTGAPIQGVEISLRPEKQVTATTDEHGLATLPRPVEKLEEERPAYLVARHGEDVTILPGEAWAKRVLQPELEWHVLDDRNLYRPGETATLKGWLRLHDPNRGGDIRAAKGVTGVTYRVIDSEDNQIATGSAKVNALGGFDFKVVLPKTPNLGYAMVELKAQGIAGETSHEL
ncbi:MAG TPA: Ig-like domain-containing protein, partial [Kofleriaceae bacterium]